MTRAGKGEEYPRTHPQGHFNTNYNLLYRLAQRFQNGEAQGVASWLQQFGQVNAEDFWSLVWFDAKLKPAPVARQQAWHYFPDHDVFYWRSDWTKNATAFAFKCGPPEGHHTEADLRKFPDWRLSSGHAHPDANSFIIFARGQYLTGDSGYAGVPLTEHHNTVVFDGKGQAKEGSGHDVWVGVPYERLDRIRISSIKFDYKKVLLTADLTSAYEPELGVTSFLYFIISGFRQQGIRYLKHFTGGLSGALLFAMGWLIFVVEIVSNCVRPVTLSLRLFVNMYADHKIGGAFLDLVAPIVPIFTIILGLFVALVQTFIFIMLSMVYLSETVPHEEHDTEEHAHGTEAMAEAH